MSEKTIEQRLQALEAIEAKRRNRRAAKNFEKKYTSGGRFKCMTCGKGIRWYKDEAYDDAAKPMEAAFCNFCGHKTLGMTGRPICGDHCVWLIETKNPTLPLSCCEECRVPLIKSGEWIVDETC